MKKLFSALLAVLILMGTLSFGVFASEAPEIDESLINSVHGIPIYEPPGEDDVIDFSPFEGKSLDEVIQDFFQENRVDPETLAFGFYNTVTGEEYYHNGDKYMVAASVYKLPLNMYYAEKVYLGEIEWSTKFGNYSYEKIQVSSLVSSNNELSEQLQEAIGDYRDYRTAIAPILGVNTHTVEERYYKDNEFTPEQIISALKKLYFDSERYPNVISYMLVGAPNNYFSYSEHRYRIAHKYGYLRDEKHHIINDAAIIYTPDPILLVMFMDNCAGAVNTMARFSSLMCDYSEYTRSLREAEPEPEPEPSPEPTPTPTPEPTPTPTPAPTHTPSPSPVPSPTPSSEPEMEEREFEFEDIHKLLLIAVAAGLLSLLFFALKKLRPASKVIAVILLMVFGVAFVAMLTLGIGKAVDGTLFPAEPEIIVQPTPSPYEEPLPSATPMPQITEYTVTEESGEEILALAQYESLEKVDGYASAEHAALAELSRLLPDCDVGYSIELYGFSVDSHDKELRIEDFSITDPEPLREALELLPGLERLDIRELPFSNETVESLIEAYPHIDFMWTVNVGPWHISSEASCFSTRQSQNPAVKYTSQDFAPLFKYCTELVALDLSRNALSSLEGIENLTKLKVLLLGDNPDIKDISPLGGLKELEFLELYRASAEDFSCLAGLDKLTDINLSYCQSLSDYSFVDSLSNLERAWLRGTGGQMSDWDLLVQNHPQVKMLFWHESGSPTAGGWRNHERELAIRKAFENWDFVTDFRSWDDVEYRGEYNLSPVYPSNS